VKKLRVPIQVNVYCFSVIDGRIKYLMLKRSDKNNPCWQGVTGGLDPEETLIDAAAREVFEETALKPVNVFPINYSYTYPVPAYSTHTFDRVTSTIEEHVFAVYIDPAHTMPTLSEEHSEYRWIDVDLAHDLMYWAENKKAIRLAHVLVCDFVKNNAS
jgi:dihydroneopterin triphosphate diphosphatase